jgi:hypothetical protein
VRYCYYLAYCSYFVIASLRVCSTAESCCWAASNDFCRDYLRCYSFSSCDEITFIFYLHSAISVILASIRFSAYLSDCSSCPLRSSAPLICLYCSFIFLRSYCSCLSISAIILFFSYYFCLRIYSNSFCCCSNLFCIRLL